MTDMKVESVRVSEFESNFTHLVYLLIDSNRIDMIYAMSTITTGEYHRQQEMLAIWQINKHTYSIKF